MGIRARRALMALLALLLAPSCAVSGLAFRTDERITITSPGDRDEVRAPIHLEWEAHDLAPGTTFAVFVDRPPPPPGHSVAWLFRDDEACIRDDGCPDDEFLADRDIFVTDETEITIGQLTKRRSDDRRDLHEATIVLIDRDGDRLGESAFIREFVLEQDER